MKKKIIKIFLIFLVIGLYTFWTSLPKNLFEAPTATVLYDYQRRLLGAGIAADGQWRFPQMESVPKKFEQAIIAFEDQYFYKHPGINPVSIFRAIRQNVKAGKIVSGASTLSMQVIRLSRAGKSRSVYEKLKEMMLALRLELRYSKQEILNLYASFAPFGGNTIGLETAAWRYFGTLPEQLSWGETAMLAVLPNQPSLIYPGKHDSLLINKRNRLLTKLFEQETIDPLTYELAIQEPIPASPAPLPQIAPHLLAKINQGFTRGKKFHSSLHLDAQVQVNKIVERHYQRLSLNQVHNAAVLVAEINSGKIVAYTGNTSTSSKHQNQVDIIRSRRSPGSTLKPFLYAASLDEGLIMPASLLPDIPTYYQGFSPKNFSLDYSGAVPANQALTKSLNIPFVQLLDKYSYPKFNHLLKQIGFTSLDQPPDHYGLSIILGGAEVTLFELADAYLLLTQKGQGKEQLHPLSYNKLISREAASFPLSGQACWHTLETLLELNRPGEENAWRSYQNSQQIAWKTGTSFGFKDAWAVGASPEYLVAVWVGNADGEGRPDIIGSKVAAPILFDLFNQFRSHQNFMAPSFELKDIMVCNQSGFKAGENCKKTQRKWMIPAATNHPTCPYHQVVFINTQEERVIANCESVDQMESKKWFVLPPAMANYYRRKHPDYIPLPVWSPACKSYAQQNNIEMIYPGNDSELFIPLELNGQPGKVVFELAHHLPGQKVYWHLNDEYLGQTQAQHQLAAWIPQGNHHLVVVDELGERLVKRFTVLSK